ncbi:MAG TPA: hypothetical protein VFA07_19990 [Chthonomonadaceae bacterium]|nr:hypothetical protein [Chthonomonadaceae bacterium]
MIENRLLGFDARVVAFDQTSRMRDMFFLRLDIREPRSTDDLVWPSVFDTRQGIGMTEAERQQWGFVGLKVPSWIGPNNGLWEDLERMRDFLAENTSEVRQPYMEIAISCFSDDGFLLAALYGGPYLEPTMPARPETSWRLLGFDVSDGSLISGLMDCAYTESELAVLREPWSSHLNEYHLFTDVAKALKFCKLTDKRVPEHAPFFVYGLWEIESISPV